MKTPFLRNEQFRPQLAASQAQFLRDIRDKKMFHVADHTLFFRGTVSWKQLVTEARIGQVEWDDGGTVHRGFADIYAELRPELTNLVSEHTVKRLSGHSLGGVLAILCAQDMIRLGVDPPRSVYTFGTPRVGNREFANAIVSKNLPIFRIANTEDLVTRLPPLCRHVGPLVRVEFDEGSVVRNHSLDGYIRCMENYGDAYSRLGADFRRRRRVLIREKHGK